MKLTSKKLGKYWWIVGDEEDGPYGPYESRKEAEEDRVGIKRFFRCQDEPGFMTSEKGN